MPNTTLPKPPNPDRPHTVAAAAIVDSLAAPTRMLAARRTRPAELAGGWEFPGGKVEPGESVEAAAHREIAEELGVRIRLGRDVRSPVADPDLDPDGGWLLSDQLVLRLFLAEIVEGEPMPLADHDELAWLDLDDPTSPLDQAVPWLGTDIPIVREVDAVLRRMRDPNAA